MERIYYMLLTVMLVLGCERHVTLYPGEDNVSRQYIFFNADVTDTKGNVVQGTSLSADPGTDFGVFGYRYHGAPIFSTYKAGTTVSQGHASAFDNVARVYRPSGSSIENPLAFIYDGLALWHSDSHTFYAYYPYDNPKSSIVDVPLDAENFSANPYISYTQPTELSQMVDVMTAKKTAVSADGEVELHFEHRLFAFEVVLKNNHSVNDYQPEETISNLRITDAIMQFHNVAAAASLYFDNTVNSTGTTNISKDFVTEQFTISAPPAGGNSVEHNFNDNEGPFLLLPCPSIQISFTLKFINAWNEECTYQISNLTLEPEGGFLQGHEYALIIDKECSNNEITFVASLQDYTDDNKIEINIEYN